MTPTRWSMVAFSFLCQFLMRRRVESASFIDSSRAIGDNTSRFYNGALQIGHASPPCKHPISRLSSIWKQPVYIRPVEPLGRLVNAIRPVHDALAPAGAQSL